MKLDIKNILHSQRGSTLIMAVVSAAVVLIAVNGWMGLNDQSNNFTKRKLDQISFNKYADKIEAILQENCTNSLKDQTVSSATNFVLSSATSPPITLSPNINADGLEYSINLPSGDLIPSGGIVTSMNLEIKATDPTGENTKTYSREIGLTVLLDSLATNMIVACGLGKKESECLSNLANDPSLVDYADGGIPFSIVGTCPSMLTATLAGTALSNCSDLLGTDCTTDPFGFSGGGSVTTNNYGSSILGGGTKQTTFSGGSGQQSTAGGIPLSP